MRDNGEASSCSFGSCAGPERLLLLAFVISRFSKFGCFRTESIIFADQLLAFFRFFQLHTKPLTLYEVQGIELMSLWPSVDRGVVGEKFMGPPSTDLQRLVVSLRLAAWTNKTVRGCKISRGKPTNVHLCYVFQMLVLK